MEFISASMHRVIKFLVRFFVTFWVLVILIILGRSIYCYSAASASAENLLPQIARIVAEENGCPTDNVRPGTIDQSTYAIIDNLIDSANHPYASDPSLQCAAYEYILYSNENSFIKNGDPPLADCNHDLEELPISFTVRKVDPDTNLPTGKNLSRQTETGIGDRVVQRGDIIEISLTVYATVITDLRFGPNDTNGITTHWAITKKMRVPAVKYYRGLT